MSLGLDGTNAQPVERAKRRVSKIWNGFAAAGWTCRVAVVCMAVASFCGEE
jgi:L-asparagine transporter-like permease